MSEFCQTFDYLRNDASKYDAVTKSGFFPVEITTNLRTCLHGDGAITQNDNINENIRSLNNFAVDLNAITATTFIDTKST